MRHAIVLFTSDRGITLARGSGETPTSSPAEAGEAYLDRLASRIAI